METNTGARFSLRVRMSGAFGSSACVGFHLYISSFTHGMCVPFFTTETDRAARPGGGRKGGGPGPSPPKGRLTYAM